QSSTVLQNAFNNWLAANKPAGLPPKPPLVILCVSGGGSRAAVWACAILEELRRQELALRANRNPHPPGGGLLVDQIRIITGASGGIVGSAYYTAFSALGGGIPPKGVQAEIAAWSARNKGAACPELAWALARDHLSAVVSTMLLYDLPWTWVPFRTCIIDPTRMPSNWSAWDRGRSLEKALADNTRPKGKKATSPLESPHAALAPFEQSALIPSIIYSPMLVEDARRLLISNLDLSALCEIDVPYGSGVRRLSRPAIEFYKIFPEARATFQVCTAARLAASFPFVSPALFLPTEPKRRVVDAGYYDNYGVDLAAEWVYHNSQDISTHCSSVLFLETRAYANEADRQSLFSSDDGGFIRGLSSPLSAVMTMRERSPWYRNDERLRGMGDLFAERHKAPRFVVSEYVELDGTAPLGWSMTERQRDEIIQSASTAVSQLLVRLRNVYKWI
ncbi:MAG TPA: patatin-like phospholipase family protein, partial [Chloroflexota bacterium]|nr:patatin-like phospholipase family protein [Chloroflexota bacterium]